MKYSVIISLLIFTSTLLLSCSNSEGDETPFYSCIVRTAHDTGFDADVELNAFEELLVENGVLSSKSGQAKIDFHKKVVATREYPKIPMEVLQNDRLVQLHEIIQFSQCPEHQTKDNPEYAKIFALSDELKKQYKGDGSFSPVAFAKAAVAVFDADDLEKPYYRAHFLLEINSALVRKVESTVEEDTSMVDVSNNPQAYQEFATVITLDKEGNPVLDNKPCSWEELSALAKPFIQKQTNLNKEFLQIELPNAEFQGKYNLIVNYLNTAYREILEEITNEKYGTNLIETERSLVNQLAKEHPMRMIQLQQE